MKTTTLASAMNVEDILITMQDSIVEWIAQKTMTLEQIAQRIVDKAEEEAQADAMGVHKMREAMLSVKDPKNGREERLEWFDGRKQELAELGAELTAKKAQLMLTLAETHPDVQAIELQIQSTEDAYTALLENKEFILLQTTYARAEKAYKLAVDTARMSESNFKMLEESMPALVQALATYQRVEKITEETQKKKHSPFASEKFLGTLMSDVDAAERSARAWEDVDRDLKPEEKNDPVEDMLTARRAKKSNADVRAIFEEGAKNVKL